MWTARLLLEQQQHPSSCFLTLTYRDPAPVELRPRDTQLFMKRLRKRLSFPVRFFLVGEYGDQTFRPHYHAALFGVDPGFAPWIEEAWGLGFIHVGELNRNSAQYLAGYVTKKMTSEEDPRLDGRHPEFSRMSRRPGIGVGAVENLAKSYLTKSGSQWLQEDGDVTATIRMDGKLFPLGNTLRQKLRESVGWAPTMPEETREARMAAFAARTPEQIAQDERRRSGGVRIATSRQKLANTRKVL